MLDQAVPLVCEGVTGSGCSRSEGGSHPPGAFAPFLVRIVLDRVERATHQAMTDQDRRRPHLEKERLDEFNTWAASFVDPWKPFHTMRAGESAAQPGEYPNWDSDVRLELPADPRGCPVFWSDDGPEVFA
jgi:hypothetical protein